MFTGFLTCTTTSFINFFPKNWYSKIGMYIHTGSRLCVIALSNPSFLPLFTARSERKLNKKDDGKLLQQISRQYTSKEFTESLASELLDGKLLGGGAAFISNQVENGKFVTWKNIALSVLHHWLIMPDRYQSQLFAAIRKSIPHAAYQFEPQLNNRFEAFEQRTW